MLKRRLFTAAGVVSSFIIAAGGWFLTDALINKKTGALLSVKGVTRIDAPSEIALEPFEPVKTDEPRDLYPIGQPDGALLITSNGVEINFADIIKNFEAIGNETLHDPASGQISMTEAIEAGDAFLSAFRAYGMFRADLLLYERAKTNAYLCQNITPGRSGFLDPVYSYWTVTFRGGETQGFTLIDEAKIIINASTGLVICAEISPFSGYIELNTDLVENALLFYMDYLNIKGTDDDKTFGMHDPYYYYLYNFSPRLGVYAAVSSYGDRSAAKQIKMYLLTEI